MSWLAYGNLYWMRVQNLFHLMMLPLYFTAYIYTMYSRTKVAQISLSNTEFPVYSDNLIMGLQHCFIYPIPERHSKLLQYV